MLFDSASLTLPFICFGRSRAMRPSPTLAPLGQCRSGVWLGALDLLSRHPRQERKKTACIPLSPRFICFGRSRGALRAALCRIPTACPLIPTACPLVPPVFYPFIRRGCFSSHRVFARGALAGLYSLLPLQIVQILASLPFLFMIFFSTTFSPGAGVEVIREFRYLFARFYWWCDLPTVKM